MSAAKVGNNPDTSQLSLQEKSMHQAAKAVADEMHLGGNVDVLTSTDGLTGRKKNAKGWYDPQTGRITIVLPNHNGRADVVNTMLHEAVGHYGLRELVGKEKMNEFLDFVFKNADKATRSQIAHNSAKYGWDMRKATEEYMASMAEDGTFKNVNKRWWHQLKLAFLKMLHKLGFAGFSGTTLSDNDLRYLLWRSWKNLTESPARNIYQVAEDAAMQEHLQQTPEAKQRHEEEVYFREVNDSIKDIVDKTKSDLAKLNEDKRNHKAEAVKAIGGRLSELNKAMREQRAYDLHTVASITDMAKTMLKNRLLTNLSSTEVSRLLSVVNNVHGKKDIKNYVQKVLDMMVDNQVSNLNHALTNLLLFNGKKVNAQGVEVQGKLDLDGQRMAEVVWNGIGLTDEVFTIESTQVQNRATITRINRAKPCMYHQLNATAKAHL